MEVDIIKMDNEISQQMQKSIDQINTIRQQLMSLEQNHQQLMGKYQLIKELKDKGEPVK